MRFTFGRQLEAIKDEKMSRELCPLTKFQSNWPKLQSLYGCGLLSWHLHSGASALGRVGRAARVSRVGRAGLVGRFGRVSPVGRAGIVGRFGRVSLGRAGL